MKRKIYYFLLLLLCAGSHCFAQDVLTNKSIIALSKAGLPSSIIINKLKMNKCAFDLSTDALIDLKNNKVADDVLNAMIDKQGTSITTGNAGADSVIVKLQQSGIYYYDPRTNRYSKVDATVVTGTKMNANLLGTFKSKSTLDGPEANLQVDRVPVFYFYFSNNQQTNNLSNTNASNVAYKDEFVDMLRAYAPSAGTSNAAFSPNDFKLIKMDKSRNTRSFQSGKMSMYSGVSSGADKNVQTFKYESITPNLYKVYFPKGLPNGEYCFIYASSLASGGITASAMNSIYHNKDIKVFDFGTK
jgi:hypothetical protein